VIKHAQPEFPVNELLTRRWSPYGMSPREIAAEDLRALFEAARWAPSSYNAQPWHYVVGRRGDAVFERILGCLVSVNQTWARHAAVLALGVVRRSFPHNGKPNRAAEHDLGLASANLSLEATARGIAVHQMSGVNAAGAGKEFGLPADHEVLTALALGYPGTPEGLDPALLARDGRPRERRPLQAFVYGGTWGERADFLD